MITPFTFHWFEIRLYSFSLFFIILGILHFTRPKAFVSIIPFLPYKYFIVYLTGFIEIALAIALLFEPIREISIWITIFYLIAIFPANVYMAMNPDKYKVKSIWLNIRLPFQLLFILWVYSLN